MSDELDSLRRRLAGSTPAIRLSGPEELIVGNQITIMRALLFLVRDIDTNGEKRELRDAIHDSVVALSNIGAQSNV